MSSRETYTIIARRSGDWWALEVPELDRVFTQTRRLDQAPKAIEEVLEGVHDRMPGTYDLALRVDDDSISELVSEARRAGAVADAAVMTAREAQRAAIATLRERGLPMRDVGELLGVSHQRIAQISGSTANVGRIAGTASKATKAPTIGAASAKGPMRGLEQSLASKSAKARARSKP